MSSADPSAPAEVLEASGPDRGSVWRTLLRAGTAAFGTNVGVLVANTLTGVFTARLLGPDGRGVLAAVIVLPQVMAYIFGLGSSRAVAYHRSRHPDQGGRLIGTWLAILLVAFVVAYGAAFLLVPVILAAQPDEAITYARLYLLTIASALLVDVAQGMLLGQQRFGRYNWLRLAQPATLVLSYVVLWQTDAFTVTAVLIANAILGGLIALGTLLAAIRHDGVGRPSPDIARSTLLYGLKAHGTTLAVQINVRLDLLIIPAFLSAATVGLYAVAINITAALASLAGSLAVFVLPLAAREQGKSRQIIVGSLWATFTVAASGAIVLIVLGEIAVRLVYGAEFVPAVEALRILLIGTVPGICTGVLVSGLDALGRPLAGSFAIGVAAVVTVVGLLLFLRDGGIIAAAIVSSTQAFVAFTLALVLYKRAAGLGWRELAPDRAILARIAGGLRRRLRR